MTCIIGLEHDNGMVSIGGDSAGVDGWLQIRTRVDGKVFINGPMIFGFTSSFRMGQLLRYSLSIPEQLPSCIDDYKFMCTSFIDAVRQCLKTGGYAKVKDGEDQGGVFLVGTMQPFVGCSCLFRQLWINTCAEFGPVPGRAVMMKIVIELGGQRVTFPDIQDLCPIERNERIRNLYNGENCQELSLRFELHPVHIKRIARGEDN